MVLKPAEDTPLSSYQSGADFDRGRLAARRGECGDRRRARTRERHWRAQGRPGGELHRFDGGGPHYRAGVRADFKHCHLEMGGKNIIIVMDDANLDLAVEGAIWGGFGTTGQRCTAASRVAVHKRCTSEFIARFVTRAKSLRVGDGLDADDGHGAVHQRAAIENGDELCGDRARRRRSEIVDRRQPPGQAGRMPRAGSTSRPCLAIAIRECGLRRKRFSGRWCR